MEWLASFSSVNVFTMVVVIAVIVFLFIVIRKGWLNFSGHGLNIGVAEKEAKIRTMQQVFAKSLFESTIHSLPTDCEYYHSRFVISQVLDEVERMIQQNHITTDDAYISTEQMIIYNIVLKYTTISYFRTQEFKDYINKLVEDCIKQLVKIRKQYS